MYLKKQNDLQFGMDEVVVNSSLPLDLANLHGPLWLSKSQQNFWGISAAP